MSEPCPHNRGKIVRWENHRAIGHFCAMCFERTDYELDPSASLTGAVPHVPLQTDASSATSKSSETSDRNQSVETARDWFLAGNRGDPGVVLSRDHADRTDLSGGADVSTSSMVVPRLLPEPGTMVDRVFYLLRRFPGCAPAREEVESCIQSLALALTSCTAAREATTQAYDKLLTSWDDCRTRLQTAEAERDAIRAAFEQSSTDTENTLRAELVILRAQLADAQEMWKLREPNNEEENPTVEAIEVETSKTWRVERRSSVALVPPMRSMDSFSTLVTAQVQLTTLRASLDALAQEMRDKAKATVTDRIPAWWVKGVADQLVALTHPKEDG